MSLHFYLPLMLIYFLVIALGLALFAVAIVGLMWLIRGGQLDDLDTPAHRMLADDVPPSQAADKGEHHG